MNSIYHNIQTDALLARKSGEKLKAVLLTTVMSEIAMIGKNANREVTDEDSLKVIAKFLKGINETMKFLESAGSDMDEAYNTVCHEKVILTTYLPVQLTDAKLREIIGGLVSALPVRDQKQMGVVVKALKANHDGQYEGGKAAAIIKELLAAN